LSGFHGRQGRKQLPAFLKVVNGGRKPKKRRQNGKVAKPRATPPPQHLSEIARRTWVQWEAFLREIAIFEPQYAVALEEACELRADCIELRREIAIHGRYYQTATQAGAVITRAHPAHAQLADAQRRLATYLAEFGLTPSGRARLLSITTMPDLPDGSGAESFFT
jgi:P27 family predicted phage terminase small subunit